MKLYTNLEKIGRGSFGDIYKARNTDGGTVAIKKIGMYNPDLEKYIRNEISVIEQNLKHRNIVKVFECTVDKEINIVMEFCELGDLNCYMVSHSSDLNRRLSFMYDMTRGVNYLHSQHIVHRDLKPENVLLTEAVDRPICKITDFSVSKMKITKHEKFSTYLGSYAYMAPEITGHHDYSQEVDVYALGLLYFVVYKHLILTNSFKQKNLIPGFYTSENRIAYLNEQLKKHMPPEDMFIAKYSIDSVKVGSLIYSMLLNEPKNRPEMEHVLVQIVEIKTEQKQEEVERELRVAYDKAVGDRDEAVLECDKIVQEYERLAKENLSNRRKIEQLRSQCQEKEHQIVKLKEQKNIHQPTIKPKTYPKPANIIPHGTAVVKSSPVSRTRNLFFT